MMTLTIHLPILVGLLFIVLGAVFLVRAGSAKATPITVRTHRKLGLIYVCVGTALTLFGICRL